VSIEHSFPAPRPLLLHCIELGDTVKAIFPDDSLCPTKAMRLLTHKGLRDVHVAVQSIFKMADVDASGAVDWSEFANLLVVNVAQP
jgi:hypothetical protein